MIRPEELEVELKESVQAEADNCCDNLEKQLRKSASNVRDITQVAASLNIHGSITMAVANEVVIRFAGWGWVASIEDSGRNEKSIFIRYKKLSSKIVVPMVTDTEELRNRDWSKKGWME